MLGLELKGLQQRATCEQRAIDMLLSCTVGMEHVGWMLDTWVGNKNAFRKRVRPPGWGYVESDMFELVAKHTGGRPA